MKKTLFDSLNVYHYLNQGKWWYPNGLPRVLIAEEMNDGWRQNAANWLIKRADLFEFYYTQNEIGWLESGMSGTWVEVNADGSASDIPVSMMPRGEMAQDAFERELDERTRNPEEWIKTTPLYKALLNGLDE